MIVVILPGRRAWPNVGTRWSRNMTWKPWAGMSVLLVCLIAAGARVGHAQGEQTPAIRAEVLRSVQTSLSRSRDARLRGPIAFDPRILRAPEGAGPRGWPDSTALTWIGDVRSATLSPSEVNALLAEVNGPRGLVRWQPCGGTSGASSCDTREHSAVVAISEPLINGDVAQVLVLTWYESTIKLHPWAFMANLYRLQRVGGEWTVTGGHNWAAN